MANILNHQFVSGRADGADGTQVQPSHWNSGHKYTGGVDGNLLVRDTTDATFGADWSTGLTYSKTTKTLSLAHGIITADAQAFSSTATWNNAAVTFTHWKANITDTASAAASLLLDLQVGGISKFSVSKVGKVTAADTLTVTKIIRGGASDFQILNSAQTAGWSLTDAAPNNWYPTSDNSQDIGSSANRARSGYFGTAVIVGSTPATSGSVLLPNAGPINWRNAANSADILGINVDATNSIVLGGTGVSVRLVGVGPHAIGGATDSGTQLLIQGTLTSPAARVDGVTIQPSLTSAANGSMYALRLNPTFIQAASGTHPLIAAQRIDIATVTAGLAAVNDTASLYLAGPMTATVTGANYALWVAAGPSRFGGYVRSTSPTAGIGYGTGAGGTVTQLTSKSTGVTLNTVTGTITMTADALAASATVSFVLTNSAIAATDAVLTIHASAGTIGAYTVVSFAAAGSATIAVSNYSAGPLSEAIVLRFVVFNSVNV